MLFTCVLVSDKPRLISPTALFLNCIQLHRGLMRLRHRVEKRRLTRLGVWRGGVWAETYVATGALERWRRHARVQRDIITSFRIACSRSQARKLERARCSALGRTFLESLKRHTRARKLERRVLRAWASHTERATHASKRVRPHAGQLCKAEAKILPSKIIIRLPWRSYPLLLLRADKWVFFLMSCEYRGIYGWYAVEF